MCQLIYLGSVEPLDELERIDGRNIDSPGSEIPDLLAVLPDARHFYSVGGCQCYFHHYPEEEIAEAVASNLAQGNQEMAISWRTHLEACNAFVIRMADYLTDRLASEIWLVWKWEGQPINPECVRWECGPAYFRDPGFTMPPEEGVIHVIPGEVWVCGNVDTADAEE